MITIKEAVLSLALLVWLGPLLGAVHAQVTLDQRMGELSKQISDGLTENQKQTIAVVEFADLRGNVTDFGRFISEELITRLYQTKKFKVIERQLLNKVVAEQKLSLTGVIDKTSAQKLGNLLGVDAIASGTISDLGKTLKVNARLIGTSTAEVFAVAQTEITKDDSVMALMGAGNTGPTNPRNSTAPSYQGNALASKDMGSLRVVLKSIVRVKYTNFFRNSVNGIRCTFEFVNLETQRPVVVAINANQSNAYDQIGSYLRSALTDETGSVWRLHNSDVTGLSVVGVGAQGYGRFYNAAEIVSALSKRDDLGSDISKDGNFQYRFIFGSTTEMSPGQSVTVTMTFQQDSNQTSSSGPPKTVQIATEIVIGVLKTGTNKSYSLHNFTFDQVSVRAGGS